MNYLVKILEKSYLIQKKFFYYSKIVKVYNNLKYEIINKFSLNINLEIHLFYLKLLYF